MMSDVSGKSQAIENEPEKLVQLLDLELVQKRAVWKQAAERHRIYRKIGLLFILLIVAAVVVALFSLFSRATEDRNIPRPPTSSDGAKP
jgi:hypothetical protein